MKDLIGFSQQFMSQAASHFADRKELRVAVQKERLLCAEESRRKEVLLAKQQVGYFKVAF